MDKKEKKEENPWECQGGIEILMLPLGPPPPSLTEQDRRQMEEDWEKEKQRRLQEASKRKPED